MLQIDNMNADAIYVRGLCLYYEDNVERAFSHFTQVFSNIDWCSILSFSHQGSTLCTRPREGKGDISGMQDHALGTAVLTS